MEVESTLGTVVDNDDPGKGGAIQVALPDLGGDTYPEWIEPIHPAGVFFHPKPGDTVAVVTPAGDAITEASDEARYQGKVTAEQEGYPEEFKTNYPDRRGFKTPQGHLVIFDDKTGDVVIKNGKTGVEVKLTATALVELGTQATDFLVKGTTWKATLAGVAPLVSNPVCPEVATWCNALLTILQNMPLSTRVKTE